MKPDILNPKWQYIPSHKTNISETFKRIRREMRKQQPEPKVFPIKVKQHG